MSRIERNYFDRSFFFFFLAENLHSKYTYIINIHNVNIYNVAFNITTLSIDLFHFSLLVWNSFEYCFNNLIFILNRDNYILYVVSNIIRIINSNIHIYAIMQNIRYSKYIRETSSASLNACIKILFFLIFFFFSKSANPIITKYRDTCKLLPIYS